MIRSSLSTRIPITSSLSLGVPGPHATQCMRDSWSDDKNNRIKKKTKVTDTLNNSTPGFHQFHIHHGDTFTCTTSPIVVHLQVTFLQNCNSLESLLDLLVDKDNLINYQIVVNYGLLIRILTYQPTVDKTIVLSANSR